MEGEGYLIVWVRQLNKKLLQNLLYLYIQKVLANPNYLILNFEIWRINRAESPTEDSDIIYIRLIINGLIILMFLGEGDSVANIILVS